MSEKQLTRSLQLGHVLAWLGLVLIGMEGLLILSMVSGWPGVLWERWPG
jgi:hypothetical protein